MARTRFTLAFDHHNMVPAPAAKTVVQVMFKSEDGVMFCYGTAAVSGAPLTDAGVYAPGCLYILVVDSGSLLYQNAGTRATPTWDDQDAS